LPRPRRRRRVYFRPSITYFKPAGARLAHLEESILTIDELEAIRLTDLLETPQKQAAKKMNISQSTFHRIISSARKKLADAVVNGKAIRVEGGNYIMAGRRRRGRF